MHAETGHFIYDAEPIYRIPATARWGRGSTKNVLCIDSVPLKVTVIGKVLRSYLFLKGIGKTGVCVELKLL